MKPAVVVVLIAMCLLAQSALAQSALSPESEALRGMTAMAVIVEEIPELRGKGVDADSLRITVELALRRNAISVVDPKTADTVVPYLWVQPNVSLINEDRLIVYHLLVEMKRPVLIRVPGETALKVVMAGVWIKTFLGTSNRPSAIRETLTVLMDMFLNDYLAVNPVKR